MRHNSSTSEFHSNIAAVRDLEDCIRATKKYTEGIGTMRRKHPIQGEDFPSIVFCKYYEVYPDTDVSWDMPVGIALDWLWQDTLCLDVMFKYDYRANKASVSIKDGEEAVKELERAIPRFKTALERVVANGNSQKIDM